MNRRFHPRSYLLPDDVAWQQSRRLAPGETQAQCFELGHALIGRLVARAPLLEVPLRLSLPRADGEALSGCVESARRERAEQAARELTPSEEARLRPSERIARLFRGRREGVPRWVGWLAMLEEFAVVHDDPRGMPKRPTDRISIRDGWCCSAPGCTSRCGLQVHHVKYRSRLGPEEEWNEILLCALCRIRHKPHTGAMELLRAGVDQSAIALWLGHESVETTQIYLHADLSIKERALARTAPVGTGLRRYRAPDPLLAFLEAL